MEANLYLAVFYALYYLVFRSETYYQLNRIYLLACTVMAFVIPVVQIGVLNPPATQLRGVVITTFSTSIKGMPVKLITDTSWPFVNYLLLGYGLIVMLLVINLFFKIYKLIRLSHTNRTDQYNGFKLIELPDENNAFSFFNYLFISKGLSLSSTIISHELIHIKQKHSWDIIYLELLKIINWFNPIIYLLQNSIKEVHEFIADNQTINTESNVAAYTDFLVNNAYGLSENILTNTFFNKSLLKKRIMMLHQKRSGRAARLKYLLVLPISGGLLCASTLGFSKTYALIDLAPGNEVVRSANQDRILSDTLKSRSKTTAVTTKGYKYQETGYFINHKTNFRVIITEKNGDQKAYYKNSATTADLKLLKDKYGYTFPSMQIFDMPPPPPPAAPTKPGKLSATKPSLPVSNANNGKIAPPPPPMPPVDKPEMKDKSNMPPPPPPAEAIITYDKSNGRVIGQAAEAHTIVYAPTQKTEGKMTPLIIVNGQKYDLKEKLKSGQYLYFTASDSTINYEAGNATAKRKWGTQADNGVIELYGKTSVEIK